MLKAVILAAGKGTRMKSDLPKVLHTCQGTPMVQHVINACRAANVDDICLVVGHKAELVKETVGDSVKYVEQTEQLGTGHAVKCAAPFIGNEGDVLVLCGDTPLIRPETLKALVDYHKKEGHKVTAMSVCLDDPTGYGRIKRYSNTGAFDRIVEHKDATDEEREIKEINSGFYIFDAAALSESLALLKNDNVQKEYYLTDTLEIIKNKYGIGMAEAFTPIDAVDDVRGVNSPDQLAEAETIMAARQ